MKEILDIDTVLSLHPCESGMAELRASGVTSCHLSYITRLPLTPASIVWFIYRFLWNGGWDILRMRLKKADFAASDLFIARNNAATDDEFLALYRESRDRAVMAEWDNAMKELYG